MTGAILIYIGAFITLGWGVAHLFPTKNVVREFGELAPDNRRTLTMEWINEGVTLIAIGVLVGLVTLIDRSAVISRMVYWWAFVTLNVLSVISMFTGARNSFIAFRLCPYIFTSMSFLILTGSYID